MTERFTLDCFEGKCPHCKEVTKLFYVYERPSWDAEPITWKDTGEVECLACGEYSPNGEGLQGIESLDQIEH